MFAITLANEVARMTGAAVKVTFQDDVSQDVRLTLGNAKLCLTQYRGDDTEAAISVVLSDGATKMVATRRFEEDEAMALTELLQEAVKYGARTSASIADQIRIAAPELVECVWVDDFQLTTLLLTSGEKLSLCVVPDEGAYAIFNERFRTIARAEEGDYQPVIETLISDIAKYMERQAAHA